MADDTFESVVKEFGNSGHIIVPKDYVGDVMKVEQVCSFTPPLFESIQDDVDVVIDATIPEDIECPVPETGEVTLVGTVCEQNYNLTKDNKTMMKTVLVECNDQRYRIETKRKTGDDSWNTYTLEREADAEEIDDIGEILSMEPPTWWVKIGTVTSMAVKKKAPAN